METCLTIDGHGNDDPTMVRSFVTGKRAKEHGYNVRPTPRRQLLSATWLLLLCLWGPWPQPSWADSKDGTFPSADQVGGQVYPDPVPIGTPFPDDVEVHDLSGRSAALSRILAGKKAVLAFFIVAAPVSVLELKKLEEFASQHAPDVQVVHLHVDIIHADLMKGAHTVEQTARTLAIVQKEQGLRRPMFIVPSDSLSPQALSNRLAIRGVPTIFVVGANGQVERIFIGPHDWKQGDL